MKIYPENLRETFKLARNKTWDHAVSQCRKNISYKMRDQVQGQVQGQVWGQVWDQVLDQVLDQVYENLP